MDNEHRQMLAKLVVNAQINRARIKANPEPTLNRMSREITKLLKVISDLEYALSPDLIFDLWESNYSEKIPHPRDIQGEAMIRCNAALKILRDFNQTGLWQPDDKRRI